MSKRTQARTSARARPSKSPVVSWKLKPTGSERQERMREAIYFNRVMQCRGRACNQEALIMMFREPGFHAQLIFDAAMRGQWP